MTDHRSGIPGQWSALFWFRLGSLIPRILRSLFKSSFDCIFQLCWLDSRLKPFQNLSIPADQEFREIPFDFALLLAFQEGIKGAFILPVDLKLLCKCFLAHFPTNMVSKYTTESVMLSIQKSTSFLLLPYELLFVFDYNVVKAVIAAGNTAMKPKER